MSRYEKQFYFRGLRATKIALNKAQKSGWLVKEEICPTENLYQFHPYTPTKKIIITVNDTTISNPDILVLGEPCGTLYISLKKSVISFSPETISHVAIGLLGS